VQQNCGYTATWAGLVLSPGGIVTMLMMFVVGRISGRVQPKYMIIAGALVVAAAMYDLTRVYSAVGFWFFASSRMLLGIGCCTVFLSLIRASYKGLSPDQTDQGHG